MNKEEMIELIRTIAKEQKTDVVPRHQFLKRSHISERSISKLFGSYNGLVEAAGLSPTIFPTSDRPIFSDDQLLSEIIRVLRLPDSKLTRIYFEQNGSFSPSVCERRFGGWINALRTAQGRLDKEKDNRLIDKMTEYTASANTNLKKQNNKTEEINSPKQEPAQEQQEKDEQHLGHQFLENDSVNIYGDFINFRGLQHAPVNEQGVVFLFGMICRELGYVVESVKTGFPDCEAKRIIRGKSGKWQRVRIEFEFLSRSFKAHGHDPDLCDLIVCWEHNWPDCPIEILELRNLLSTLQNKVQ
jgi:hypothetical protein